MLRHKFAAMRALAPRAGSNERNNDLLERRQRALSLRVKGPGSKTVFELEGMEAQGQPQLLMKMGRHAGQHSSLASLGLSCLEIQASSSLS